MNQPKPRHKLLLADYISFATLLATCIGIWFLLNGYVKYAIICGGIAFILDSLDGFVARRLHQSSEFGRQLDSMIDIINYPIFSALFIQLILMPNIWGAIVGFFVIATGVLRLLDFNHNGYIKHKGRLYYRGLVVCHMSLITSLLVVIQKFISIPQIIIAAVIILAAILQLSNIKTRKSGALFFWIPIAILIGIGAIIWL